MGCGGRLRRTAHRSALPIAVRLPAHRTITNCVTCSALRHLHPLFRDTSLWGFALQTARYGLGKVGIVGIQGFGIGRTIAGGYAASSMNATMKDLTLALLDGITESPGRDKKQQRAVASLDRCG